VGLRVSHIASFDQTAVFISSVDCAVCSGKLLFCADFQDVSFPQKLMMAELSKIVLYKLHFKSVC